MHLDAKSKHIFFISNFYAFRLFIDYRESNIQFKRRGPLFDPNIDRKKWVEVSIWKIYLLSIRRIPLALLSRKKYQIIFNFKSLGVLKVATGIFFIKIIFLIINVHNYENKFLWIFFYNYKHLWLDRLALVHFIYSHKFSTCYFIFYRNGVTQIENADKVGI